MLAGPSGVGKDSLAIRLREKYPSLFSYSVSHTTREPRAGERQGVDYHFVTKDEMIEWIATDIFIEHANVHGNLYGTSKQAVECAMKAGVPLLILDVEGSRNLNACLPNGIFVFVAPPSLDCLYDRLQARGTETDDEIATRLVTAVVEMESVEESLWTAILLNDDFETCCQSLFALVDQLIMPGAKLRDAKMTSSK